MIPLKTIEDLISKHLILEKELSSEKVLTEDIISEVVSQVEKKAAELDKKL